MMRGGSYPKKVLLITLGVSLFFIVLISGLTGISVQDILVVGPAAFLLSALTSLVRYTFQGWRLKVLVSSMGGVKIRLSDGFLARASSELVSITMPAFVGGEVVRGIWLYRIFGDSATAAWIAYVELLFDIVAVMLVALVAALYALYNGAVGIGIITLGVVSMSLLFYGGVLLSVFKKTTRPIELITGFLKRVSLRRGEKLSQRLEGFWRNFLNAAAQAKSRDLRIAIGSATLLTVPQLLLQGFSLWILFVGANIPAGLLVSSLAVYASTALSSLPISPGGSGVAEGSLLLFLSEVSGLRAAGVVIAWRIATYHVTLLLAAVSSAFFAPKVFGREGERQTGGAKPF